MAAWFRPLKGGLRSRRRPFAQSARSRRRWTLLQHVLRFWQSKFSQVRPLKRGGVVAATSSPKEYRPSHCASIRTLLYEDGYAIKGLERLLKEGRGSSAGTTAAGSPCRKRPGEPAHHRRPLGAEADGGAGKHSSAKPPRNGPANRRPRSARSCSRPAQGPGGRSSSSFGI